MDEDEITQRLREAGHRPVPGEVRTGHLSRMRSAAPVVARPKRFGRLAVAAAAFAGFAVGSTGFAMAGALPDPAQGVAHDVLSVVQVEVPDRPQNRGQCISAAAKAHPGDEAAKAAAKDQCPKGKPAHAGEGKGKGKGRPDHAGVPGGPNGRPHDGDPCKGPPPWAGKGAKDATPEQKQAFEDQRGACGPDADDPAEAEAREEEQERQAEEQQEAEAREQAPPVAEQPPAAQPAAPQDPPAEGGAQQQGEAPPVDVPLEAEEDAGEG